MCSGLWHLPRAWSDARAVGALFPGSEALFQAAAKGQSSRRDHRKGPTADDQWSMSMTVSIIRLAAPWRVDAS